MWINVTRFIVAPQHIDELRDFLLGQSFSFARESDAHVLSLLMSDESQEGALRSISIWRSKARGEEIFESRQYREALQAMGRWLLAPPTRTGHRAVYVDVHEVPSLIPPS